MIRESDKTKGNACVLTSGGVESSVLVADALSRYPRVKPVYVRCGLRWEEEEITMLKKFLKKLAEPRVMALTELSIEVTDLYGKHWSLTGKKVPDYGSADRAVHLPGRNILLLSKTACYAVLNGFSAIEIGILRGNPFRDATKHFLNRFGEALTLGFTRPIVIRAPFHGLRKEEVLIRGKRTPLELTFSCISPLRGEHCGACNKCAERKRAFLAAGLPDRTPYAKKG